MSATYRDLDGARSVLDMMKDNDITPGTESYGALAATYAEKGDMEGVERVSSDFNFGPCLSLASSLSDFSSLSWRGHRRR